MLVALVATFKNEEEAIVPFLKSVEQQTRRPDLVVLTVERSTTDATHHLIKSFRSKSELPVRWFWTEGNRSRGRNDAIQYAYQSFVADSFRDHRFTFAGSNLVVACTNASVLDPWWLETIVAPIESGEADVVGGSYKIETSDDRERALALVTQYAPGEEFYTALSMAFRFEPWAIAMKFDETLDTSEDTDFVRRLREAGARMMYRPEAVVDWRPSTLTFRGAVKAYYQFAKTDAKARLLFWRQYAPTYGVYLGSLVFFAVGAPVSGIVLPLTWLVFRARRVIETRGLRGEVPFAMTTALAVDVARMVGYAVGRFPHG